MKRMFSVLLAAVLAAGLLAACASKKDNASPSSAANSSSSQAPSASSQEPTPDEGPTAITVMLPLNTPAAPPDTIKDELEKLTNTKLTYQFFPADTYEEKLNTAMATGSLPQVTYMKNQATFIQMKSAIRDGQFWEIGPLLGEFPNLSKLKPQILDNTRVDGKLYSLYIGRPLARQGLIYRKDMADKLGLSAPETVADVVAMAKAFTDGNTIGLADRNDLIYGAFKTLASWMGTPNNWGEQDGQLLPEFMFPQYIASMDVMKEIRDAKAMNQDFAATSKTDQVSLFTSGKAGLYIGSMQDVDSLNKDLIKNVPDAVIDTHALIKGPNGELATWSIPGYNNVVLFPKMAIKTEDDLRKVLAYFDKMMTPEVANLMYWGIEGVHYTVVDGKAKVGDDKELIEREVKPFKDSVIGEADSNGMYESLNTLPARIHAEELIIENEKIAVHDPTAALDSETFNEEGVELQKIISDATYKYIYGSIDKAGFEKAIDEWKKRGGDNIIAEFNAAYKK